MNSLTFSWFMCFNIFISRKVLLACIADWNGLVSFFIATLTFFSVSSAELLRNECIKTLIQTVNILCATYCSWINAEKKNYFTITKKETSTKHPSPDKIALYLFHWKMAVAASLILHKSPCTTNILFLLQRLSMQVLAKLAFEVCHQTLKVLGSLLCLISLYVLKLLHSKIQFSQSFCLILYLGVRTHCHFSWWSCMHALHVKFGWWRKND